MSTTVSAMISSTSPHKKKSPARPPKSPNQRGQPEASHARKAARARRQRAQSDGSTPARPAAESTDGNGKAKHEPTKNPHGNPARRSHARQTRRRAPTGDASNRAQAAPPAAGGEPGTKDARPEQNGSNGQNEPAQARAGSPGNRNHAEKQQRHDKRTAKTNTPKQAEKTTSPERQAGKQTSPPAARGTRHLGVCHRARRRPRLAPPSSPDKNTLRRQSGCGDGSLRPLTHAAHNGRPVRRHSSRLPIKRPGWPRRIKHSWTRSAAITSVSPKKKFAIGIAC